jgi:long-chain acyl-CoA synthetase
MIYDEKPWLKFYDPGISAEIEVPETALVDQFDRIAAQYPDRPAYHFHGLTATYRQLMSQANRFANALIALGCARGDVIGVNLPNIPQYLVAQIGILKAGCASSGLSPLLTPRELAYQLADCKAKGVVTVDAIHQHRLAGVADQLPDLKIIVGTGIVDFLPWIKRLLARLLKKVPHGQLVPVAGKQVLDFMKLLSAYPDRDPGAAVSLEDRCLVQYTGGTTGLPKGTILTHRNISANLEQIKVWIAPEYGKEVLLSGFPMFHLAGLALSLAAMLMGGAQILIPDPRNTKHIVQEMAKYRPTMLVNVPSLYMMLLETPGFRELDFSQLSFCLSGASPFPAESIKDLESVVGQGKVLEVYGMTETSPIITMNPRRGRKKIGSVGVPISSTRVRLVDIETGTRQVPVGEEGELIISGPQVMKEYLNKPEETGLAIRKHDGKAWLHTGDVARMDEDGFFTIVDRTKDMLNVGGFKVFSREVEEKLHEHPAIEFCAIVGVPNPKRPGTELVKLVFQPSLPHKDRDREELKAEVLAFARENCSPYKVPRIIEVVDELPLTVVGKVDKKALR